MLTIHLIGDSITRGYGLGVFEPDGASPLYPLRSPWSIGDLIARDNAAPFRFSWLKNITVNASDAPAIVAGYVEDGIVQPGDIVVLEDAGDHGSNPGAYQVKLEAILAELTSVKVFTMKMFDYAPAPSNSQWDLQFSGVSHNDSIASASMGYNNVTCIDMNTKIDTWKSYVNGQHLLSIMQGDGVHPNHWGNCRMVGVILQAAGLLKHIFEVRSLQSIVAAAPGAAYAGPDPKYWNATVARSYAHKAIFDV